MLLADACRLVSEVSYKPGWVFSAEPFERYEATVKLHIDYVVRNSNAELAPSYLQKAEISAEFLLFVSDMVEEVDLWSKVFDAIQIIEEHETREFFSVGDDYHKPFHPHTMNGMMNWDLKRPTHLVDGLSGEPIMLFAPEKVHHG